MKTLNRRDFPGAQYPERIIQFGEGNFLRAFVDWQIDLLNEHTDLNSGVVVVRPIETSFPPSLSTQDGLYTTIIRGLNEKGEAVSDARLIRSVNREISVYSEYDEFLKLAHNPEMRFVFSNTTEAGISYHAGDKFDDAPAVSYPAKLTRLLFERFSHFNGALDKGWIIIPCELIDYNGDALRELVLRYAQEWALPEAFIQWLDQANSFCSTLVDRIVTGYPRDEVAKLEEELGYHDGFLDTAEHFYLFVIQGPKSLATELRLDKYPLNVLIVDDIKPYKERKVAILNGAHTALVPVAFQAGLDTVGEAMNDAEICAFVEKAIYEEIIPVLDLPRDELESFASAVTGRFRNPYIKHQLLSIALNGMTKFRTRILPQLLAGQKANGTLPARLTFALAALIAFYRGERNGETYPVQDDAHWLERYQQLWSQHRDRVIGTQELSVDNEYYCLLLAKELGLNVPDAEIIKAGRVRALAVERFDRRWNTERTVLLRLPQEDMCQTFGLPSSVKYESDGGPGIAQIMAFLMGSSEALKDRYDFMKFQVFQWLIGATDGHAKNFSVFIQAGGSYRLTPFYDIISAFPVLGGTGIHISDLKLAMGLNASKGKKTAIDMPE